MKLPTTAPFPFSPPRGRRNLGLSHHFTKPCRARKPTPACIACWPRPMRLLSAISSASSEKSPAIPIVRGLNVVIFLEESLGSEFWGCLGRNEHADAGNGPARHAGRFVVRQHLRLRQFAPCAAWKARCRRPAAARRRDCPPRPL